MIIGYNYWDQIGYCYGVQNQSNFLLTKYSNIYYKLSEITELYSVIEIDKLYKEKELNSLYNVIEIQKLYDIVIIQ